MSLPTPFLPIFGPLAAAVIAMLLGHWPKARTMAGLIAALIFTVWIGTLDLGDASPASDGLFRGSTWQVLGQSLALTDSNQGLLAVLWIGLGLLFLLALYLPQDSAFVPAALVAFSPLAGALLAQQFSLKAVLMIFGAALIVMTYKPIAIEKTHGALRYLIIFVLALPLLLLASWLFESRQATFFSPQVLRILFLAIALICAGFPFFMWVYPIVAEAPLLVPALIFGLVQTVVVSIVLFLLHENFWVQQDAQFQLWLRWSGVGTVLIASLLIATAVNWRFLTGHLILSSMGMTLLALTLPQAEAWQVTTFAHLPRFVAMLMIGAAMSLLQRFRGDPIIAQNRGQRREFPFTAGLLAYGMLTLLGAPLTPGFYAQWTIIVSSGQGGNIWITTLLMLALAVSVAIVLRSLFIIVGDGAGAADPQPDKEPQWLKVLIAFVLVISILFSLTPQAYQFILSHLVFAA